MDYYTFTVNVTLSKRGSYAAAAAICLARAYETGRPKKLREIAAEMAIPRTFVSQILGDLVHAGIAVSSSGRDGGHKLSRPPGQVSIAEVIEAAEGPLASGRCALGDGPCRWHAVCPLHETMTTAIASLREALTSTTLAVLAERDAAMAGGAYPVPTDSHRNAAEVSVADTVQIELPAPVIATRFRSAASWLAAHAEACDRDGTRNRTGTGGHGGETVAVQLSQATQTDQGVRIPLLWEASGPAGIYPRFSGEFQLTALDPDRSELRLSGRYRPAPGTPSQIPADTPLSSVARDTVRSFLREIAHGLEQQYAAGPEA